MASGAAPTVGPILIVVAEANFKANEQVYIEPKPAALALRINAIQVPAAVMNSSAQVALICDYDLQADQVSAQPPPN